MYVDFQIFSKRRNSTQIPTVWLKNFDCQLKQQTSIESPTLILSTLNWDNEINYCYIRDFKRYYYISDVVYMTGNRVEVSCQMDYLATYRNEILAYKAFVIRTSNPRYINSFIYDPLRSNETKILTQSSQYTDFNSPFSATGCYILRTVTNGGSVEGVSTYCLTDAQLTSVMAFMFTESNFKDVISDDTVKAFFNPFQYIVSLKWIPVSRSKIINDTVKTNVKFGWWNSGVSVSELAYVGASFHTPSLNVPPGAYGDFRGYCSQFTQYSVYIPGVGNVDISPADAHEPLYVSGELDIATGECDFYLTQNKYFSTGATIIGTYKTNLGVDIQIGQLASRLPGVVSGGVGAVTNLLSGNIGGATANAINAVQTYNSPTPSINGTQSSRWGIGSSHQVIVSCISYGTADSPDSFGQPCYQNLTLSNLFNSYVQTGNASIIIKGFSEDANTVNSMLDSGVYLN